MTNAHKSHICTGQLLDDIHIGAAQQLEVTKFSSILNLAILVFWFFFLLNLVHDKPVNIEYINR